jgi:hypothetical protein
MVRIMHQVVKSMMNPPVTKTRHASAGHSSPGSIAARVTARVSTRAGSRTGLLQSPGPSAAGPSLRRGRRWHPRGSGRRRRTRRCRGPPAPRSTDTAAAAARADQTGGDRWSARKRVEPTDILVDFTDGTDVCARRVRAAI